MGLKSNLLELIELTCNEEQALHDRLSEEQRAIPGEPDHWSPKDTVAHVAAWMGRLAGQLAAAACGETPVRVEDYEAVNASDFEENRDRPWPEILVKAKDSCRRLAEQVQNRSEAELRSTDTLPWQEDAPLWRVIAGSGYIHPVAMHLSPILIEHGHQEHATAVQQEGTRLLRALDDSPDWQGLLQYNTACHHALVGECEKAIVELREALATTPELTEWSKEDPDLASLRDMPEYQAIYGE